METIAVYWEPIIRVYGFDVIPDTSLLQIDLPAEEADYWGQRIESLQKTDTSFIMAVLQMVDMGTVRINLLLKKDFALPALTLLKEAANDSLKASVRTDHSVDVLFFHGPHFQDRYGIADAAFKVLDKYNISLLVAGCTGTSVYLVTKAGDGLKAKRLLAEAFVVGQPQ